MASFKLPFSRFFAHATARYAAALVCFLLLGAFAIKTARVETDFSAFLPPSATPEQRLLMSQLRDGLVSRLMLVALDGADEKTLAQTSRTLTEQLAKRPPSDPFDYATNGSLDQFAAQGDILMRHRYALSPDLDAQKFSAPALRAALEEQLAQLASPFGLVSRTTLPRDPTGEFLTLLQRLNTGTMPATRQGVWFSADGHRAFLLLQTRAPGFNSAEQAAAIATLRATLAAVNPQVRMTLTGPGVFAAESHRLIERDAWRLSLYSALAILTLLIFIYRSPLPILLVLTPVAFGLLIGVLVVQALFGSVHAITLGFAATLVGEAVDYPNYLLLNTAANENASGTARRIGRTLMLAVLTTMASATALTLSSFAGLAQLGVLTMIGVLVAGLATHRLIPWLLGDRVLALRRLRIPAAAALANGKWPRVLGLIATLCGALWLGSTHPHWWEQDLSNISPASAEMRALDTELRRDMGAPEVNFLLASRGDSEAAALQAAEDLLPLLQNWKQNQRLRGYDSPVWYLPPPATQAARQQALPDTPTLQRNLQQALLGLAFRADAFAPFVREVASARLAPPVTRATYAGTPLGSKLNAQVLQLDGQWLVLTSLSGVNDASGLAAAVSALPGGTSQLVDLKKVSSQMLDGYRQEALHQAAWGMALIFVLLVMGLGSLRRAWRVSAPAAAALTLCVALLVASGQRISVFHLVALLLVLGIGLNYALFFERRFTDEEDRQRTLLSLAVCVISTIATFGCLALSSTPVLHAIGSTTALGALLSLLLAALWADRPGDLKSTTTAKTPSPR